MYVGLLTRLEDFRRDALTRASSGVRSSRGTLMRGTIHLVTPGDYWPLALAVRDARRKPYLRSHGDGPDARAIAAPPAASGGAWPPAL